MTKLELVPPSNPWADRRGEIRAALEEASGQDLSVNDTHADTLIANAQALGMLPHELRLWIHDSSARPAWAAEQLVAFARRYGFTRTENEIAEERAVIV